MASSGAEVPLHLADRLALRPKEAAEALGISERKPRDVRGAAQPLAFTILEAAAAVGLSEGAFRAHLLPRCPKWYAGRSVRIPCQAFQRFVEALADEENSDGRRTARVLLDRTNLT